MKRSVSLARIDPQSRGGTRNGSGQPLRQKNMKRKLFFRIAAISMGICVAFGAITIGLLYQTSYSSMERQVSMEAKSYGDFIGNAMERYKIAAQAIAENNAISDPSNSDLVRKQTLERLAKTYGFTKVVVTDQSGNTEGGQNFRKTEGYQIAESGKVFVSDQYTSAYNEKSDPTKVLVIAAQISNSFQGNGVVLCFLSMQTVNSILKDMSIGKSGFGFAVSKEGTTVADKNLKNVTDSINYMDLGKKDAAYADMAALTQNMAAKKTGGMAVNFGGSRDYAAYTPVSSMNGWSVAAVAVQSEMMGDLNTAIYITLGLILLFLLLSVIFADAIASPIVRPILSLVGRIETLAEGDLHTQVPQVQTRDEIQKLSGSFENTVNSLNGYILEISGVLNNMAQGNFTAQITQNYKGDFVAIKEALNTIVDSLNVLFQDIIDMSDQVANGARQVSEGSQTLSQGAAEQAETIEELSASLNTIAQKVAKSAKNASVASGLSEHAMEEVARGNEQMGRMVAAMSRIDESSGKIEKIIKTIQDIAFQTNILALNAAVEAARAGEAGKGFSVVADEVRNLANKSAEAVKVTASLIADTVQAVSEGRKDADLTAKSLQSIIEVVRKMAAQVRQITSTAEEEAHAMEQVNQSVGQISNVVRTTSATAQESAAASSELDGLAQSLKEVLGTLELLPQDNGKEGGMPLSAD